LWFDLFGNRLIRPKQYRTRHSVKFHDFSVSKFDIFRRENDVTKLAPDFAFSGMGYLVTVFERPFYEDVYPLKGYNVLKFEFPAILLLKIT